MQIVYALHEMQLKSLRKIKRHLTAKNRVWSRKCDDFLRSFVFDEQEMKLTGQQ